MLMQHLLNIKILEMRRERERERRRREGRSILLNYAGI